MSLLSKNRCFIGRCSLQKWSNARRTVWITRCKWNEGSHPCSSLTNPSFRRTMSNQAADEEHHPILSLPTDFLRASDPANFDPETHQRTDASFDPHNGKPLPRRTEERQKPEIRHYKLNEEKLMYTVEWNDGIVSEYSSTWVDSQLELWEGSSSMGRVPWKGMTEDKVRSSVELSMEFPTVLTEHGMKQSIRALYQYGILLVRDTPVDDGGAGLAALASSLGGGSNKNQTSLVHQYQQGGTEVMLPRGTDGPLRTLYGTVWSTTSAGQAEGASQADSAYGTAGLPLHTDMTYHSDPPGLQIFTMVQPADKGGESLFGDGLAAAEHLLETNPDAFYTLSTVPRRYRSADHTTGWHLEASGPVITTRRGHIASIRHNDLDRLPDLPPVSYDSSQIDTFYRDLESAHAAWDAILAKDDFRLVFPLQRGETMVVANHRCFHGRYGFTSTANPRAVMGCYVGHDELSSRFRMEGFCVP